MTTLVLAEKPSVARDIAAVLGADSRKGGYLEGAGYRVTWAVGHLVGLGQPGDVRPEWGRWDAAHLPMFPPTFPLVPRAGVSDQLEIVVKLMNARDTQDIICATDAGREGELIFRYIYAFANCAKPFKRLWISSLTPDAIAAGLRELRPGSDFNQLAAAAEARSQADWLVGMNLSRAYTLAVGHVGQVLHVGRVKTPTLAMVVTRDLAIESFSASFYREVELRVRAAESEFSCTYVRPAYDDAGKPSLSARLPAEPTGEVAEDAELILDRTAKGTLAITQVEHSDRVSPPPLLFDLTGLQREANRLLGWSAAHTLDVAQRLYEKEKVLSYPRTDSRVLSKTVEATLPAIVAAIRTPYESALTADVGASKLKRRWVDDGKVTDHHAIIPTAQVARLPAGSDESTLYDLVCRRLLCAWMPDAIDSLTRVEATVTTGEIRDRFVAKGSVTRQLGWRALELATQKKVGEKQESTPTLPAGLKAGGAVQVAGAKIVRKQTRAPKYLTDADLLAAMETAGAALEGEASEAMRERGLGTPATRASTIEELVRGHYLCRDGKLLKSTPSGRALVATVDARVSGPAMTGEWEAALRKVEKGHLTAEQLLAAVRKYVQAAVEAALANGVAPRVPAQSGTAYVRTSTSKKPGRSTTGRQSVSAADRGRQAIGRSAPRVSGGRAGTKGRAQ